MCSRSVARSGASTLGQRETASTVGAGDVTCVADGKVNPWMAQSALAAVTKNRCGLHIDDVFVVLIIHDRSILHLIGAKASIVS